MIRMEVQKVETEDEYHHIRFNDPEKFDTIRTPDWAARLQTQYSREPRSEPARSKEAMSGRPNQFLYLKIKQVRRKP